MNFSESLKRFRRDFGLTQKAVAASLDIQESAYRRYELGTSSPSIALVMKLADAYDVSLDYLTGRTSDPKFHGVHFVPADVVESAIISARSTAEKRLAEVRAEGKNPDAVTIAYEYADTLLRKYYELTKNMTDTSCNSLAPFS